MFLFALERWLGLISVIEIARYRVFVTKMGIFDKSRFGQKGDHRGVIDFRSIIGATLIIMGVNLLAGNNIDVSTSKWALVYQDEPIKYLEPAYIDGNLLSQAEQDYAYNAGLASRSEPELETQFEMLTSSADEGEKLDRTPHSFVRKRKSKF